MKRLLIILCCFPIVILAQNKPLIIAGVTPNLYVNHTVAPKENYYSIGRIYNVSPKEVAPFNNLELDKGLSLAQAIKIPLSTTNFLQTGNAAADEVLIPIYHVTAGKEGLYRISVNFNKIPVETLKKWNKLKDDVVSSGTNLIVGYLKVKKELSPLAGMAKTKPADIVSKEVTAKVAAPAKETVKAAVENAPVPAPAVKKVEKQKNYEVVEKPIITPVAEEVAKEQAPTKKIVVLTGRKDFNGGFFKPDYEKQIRNKELAEESGSGAIFKSTSGWEDGKYYCLHNTSTPGTIVKITNNTNGKSIYAKVLDVIPDIKQNTGLLIRMSNSAAEELGASDAKFSCSLSYSK